MKWHDFVEFAKANPRERLATFTRPMDDWPISVVVDHRGEEPYVFDAPGWISNVADARRLWAIAMGAAARTTKPTKIALVASSWQVEFGMDGPEPTVQPSRHPDRKEAVIVVVADAEIETAFTAPVRRRKYGPPLLGEWVKADEVSGPMMDPWRDALR